MHEFYSHELVEKCSAKQHRCLLYYLFNVKKLCHIIKYGVQDNADRSASGKTFDVQQQSSVLRHSRELAARHGSVQPATRWRTCWRLAAKSQARHKVSTLHVCWDLLWSVCTAGGILVQVIGN